MTTLFLRALEQWKMCVVFRIKNTAESRYADIAYHVAHLAVEEPGGISTIEKCGIKL